MKVLTQRALLDIQVDIGITGDAPDLRLRILFGFPSVLTARSGLSALMFLKRPDYPGSPGQTRGGALLIDSHPDVGLKFNMEGGVRLFEI
jgi:hypothetical protein